MVQIVWNNILLNLTHVIFLLHTYFTQDRCSDKAEYFDMLIYFTWQIYPGVEVLKGSFFG